MAEFPDAPDVQQIVESAADDRYGRIVAVVIVLITLAAASTAWLQAGAGRDDDEAAVRAERLASQALGTTARGSSLAELRVQRQALADERRRRVTALRRQLAYGTADPAEARALLRGWREAVAITERTTDRIAAAEGIPEIEGGTSPEADPAYPNAYLVAAASEGARLAAIRDAANREGDRAEEQVGAFGVALTTFAVAVFLFGYSLTPYGRDSRRLLATVAGTMTVIAAAWTLANVLEPPQRPPEEAAAAFAEAQVALAAGRDDAALAAYDRALELRPEYPAALAGRGALLAGITGQAFDEVPSVVASEDLERAAIDFQLALRLDPEDLDATLGAASTLALLGLRGDAEALAAAERAAELAVELDPVLPASHYLRAVVALGQSGSAGDPGFRAALGEASKRVVLTDDGERPRDPLGVASPVASVLGLIGIAERASVVEAEQAELAREAVVAGAWGDAERPAGGPADVAGAAGDPSEPSDAFRRLELNVDPAGYELVWPADEPGSARGGPGAFDAATDRLVIVFYARDPDGDWVALPEVSGPVGDREIAFDPSSRAALVPRRRLDVTVPPRCLPAGEYRAEAYVDGRFAGSAEAPNSLDTEGAVRLGSLSLLACRPAGWEELRDRAGVVVGLRAPDGRSGLLATRVPDRAAPGRGRAQTRAALEAGLEQIERQVPARSVESTFVRQPFLDATVAPTEIVRTAGRGGLVASAARLSEGGIAVGAVFGPRSLFSGNGTGSSDAIDLFRTIRDRF